MSSRYHSVRHGGAYAKALDVRGLRIDAVCAFPVRVPREIVLRMNGEINKASTTPTMKDYFAMVGVAPGGGTSEEFGELIRRETDKWAKIIKAAGIKPQQRV